MYAPSTSLRTDHRQTYIHTYTRTQIYQLQSKRKNKRGDFSLRCVRHASTLKRSAWRDRGNQPTCEPVAVQQQFLQLVERGELVRDVPAEAVAVQPQLSQVHQQAQLPRNRTRQVVLGQRQRNEAFWTDKRQSTPSRSTQTKESRRTHTQTDRKTHARLVTA